MTDSRYACSVGLVDESDFAWNGWAQSAASAAERAAEEAVCQRGCDNDEVSVKVVNVSTGRVDFFDVEVEIDVNAHARPVSDDDIRRRLAEYEETSA